jgi:hypothetical protein
MKVIAFIEDDTLIKKILKHLGLWEIRNHDPPQLDNAHTPTIETELTFRLHIFATAAHRLLDPMRERLMADLICRPYSTAIA